MKQKNVLVFEHMRAQNPGIFHDHAPAHNVKFHEVDLHAGDRIPPLENYDALWVMGGSMNIWEEDTHPWLVEEKHAIRRAVVDLNMPFLGICLGHQLLGEVMGGVVRPADRHEVGLISIKLTDLGLAHPFVNSLPNPMHWLTVHFAEITEPPPVAKILAYSDMCAVHMMQVGARAFSCQFHPEACGNTVDNWLKIPGTQEKLEEALGRDGLNTFKSDVQKNLAAHNAAAKSLFSNWMQFAFK